MILDLLLFGVGIAGLYFGAEWLVGGSARLAAALGISSFIVGLTLVSFGTSAPELVVSGLASYRGSGALAVGNVLGSNVANIALILGIAAIISPILVSQDLIVRDVPIMIVSAGLVPILGWSGLIPRGAGVILLILFTVYIAHLGWEAHHESVTMLAQMDEHGQARVARSEKVRDAGIALVGLIVLAVGAHFLLGSARNLATALGVPEVVVGLSLVAFGTSLPELAASISAARRGESQIVIGNVVGSNIFNVLLILGVSAVIRPLPVPTSIIRADSLIVLGLSVALLPLVYFGRHISRREGIVLFCSYFFFLAWIVI